MNVIFGDNFWGSREAGGKYDHTGRKVPVEKAFFYGGRECRIPAVYLCPEGLVVDLCVKIPGDEVTAFFQKWTRDRRLSGLSEEELEIMEQESPFLLNFHLHGELDGCELGSNMSCSAGWHPFSFQGEEAISADSVEEEMMEEYGCDRDCGWNFIRTSLEFPEHFSGAPSRLTLTWKQWPRMYQGPHFTVGLGDQGKQVEFVHPSTGRRHVLTVRELEQDILPGEMLPRTERLRMQVERFPDHYLAMGYTVEPELPAEAFFLRDCAKPDEPVRKRGKAAAVSVIAGVAGDGLENEASDGSSFVIGGADGPTAIFLAGKKEPKHPRTLGVCSSLHYEPVNEVEWRMVFSVADGTSYTTVVDL